MNDPHELTDGTSTSLLSRVRQADPAAWGRLTQVYGPLVYAWCRSGGVPAQDTADLIQDVFVAVHRALPSFRRDQEGQSFRGWLWTITRNRVRDHFRRAGKYPAATGGTEAQLRWSEMPEDEPSTMHETADGVDLELLRGLEYVRAEFRDATWQAFWKSTVEGISTAEVANELSMSSGAVRKARFRVLKRLREELDGLL